MLAYVPERSSPLLDSLQPSLLLSFELRLRRRIRLVVELPRLSFDRCSSRNPRSKGAGERTTGHLHLSVSILDVSGCATPGYDVELTRVIPIVEKHVDYAMLAEHNPRR
ncbi:hypothetical protein C4D60_Mb04t20270 [Musa balbisiana]|uniref:Uncharacterized protein n=1 Tax=Musa balbisiana TaxID=52838 RepID=A0A4S8KDF3_MUSBA|nr:hypothetical protein C4D60_Mb04t20270 [Musa balbisiana]